MRFALIAAVLGLAACGDVTDRDADDAIPRIGVVPEFRTLAPPDLPAFFDCLRTSGQAVVSAHRGGPVRGHAENSLTAFAHTLQDAPAFLEVDVSRTRDGTLVLMHDDTVDRTTNGQGDVSELTLTEFRALYLQDAFGQTFVQRPPTLREALDWADGKTVLELDIKRGVAYEDIIREVDGAGAMGRVVFVTYSVDGAVRLARLAPQAMIYTTISDVRELDVLERRGVDLSRIVAWTGTDAPDASLVEALAARGVETRFGIFGEGRDYANAQRAGAQIVAVDDAAEALRDLDAADGEEGYAALQCVGAR